MAELVRQLEQFQYVVRVPDPTDGRAKLVTPTDRVRKLHRDLDAIRRTARRGLPGD